MKIALINPSMTGRTRRGPMEPLAFAVLAGLTPRHHEVVFYDECVTPLPDTIDADLVAISAHTFTARRAYQIALRFRRRGVPVVMGGHHPTLLPGEAGQFADAVVIGEAEAVWPKLLEDAEAGQLQQFYCEPVNDLSGIPFDRRLFRGKRYGPVRLVQFARGCRFNCDFCSVHRFFGGRTTQRPVEEVIEEVRGLGPGHLFFVDDNLWTADEGFTQLMEGLIPLKRRWTCQASIDVADDPARLRLMSRAGCYSILIGFESTDLHTLKSMKKSWNKGSQRYEETVARLHDHGILVYGTFVFGYDQDTPEAFEACREFCSRAKLFLAAFNVLTPLPGTPTFHRLEQDGRFGDVPWWLDPSSRFAFPTFQPARMERQELADRVASLRDHFYSRRSILRRAFGTGHIVRSPSSLAFHLFVNTKYRWELDRMIYASFGDPADLVPIPRASVGKDQPFCDRSA